MTGRETVSGCVEGLSLYCKGGEERLSCLFVWWRALDPGF